MGGSHSDWLVSALERNRFDPPIPWRPTENTTAREGVDIRSTTWPGAQRFFWIAPFDRPRSDGSSTGPGITAQRISEAGRSPQQHRWPAAGYSDSQPSGSL